MKINPKHLSHQKIRHNFWGEMICRRYSTLSALYIAILFCLGCGGFTDRTLEERAVGADIVQAVVDIVRENCIYPNDRVFLRRLAYVQSQDGLDVRTFRPDFYGGIWQVRVETNWNLRDFLKLYFLLFFNTVI